MSRIRSWYGSLLWHASGHRGVEWRLRSGEICRLDPRCRWIRHPDYEAPVVDYLRQRVAPGFLCLDVGAHVGFYAIQMALWTAGSGSVVAFEPNPYARQLLENNIALNGLADRVRVEPLAISDSEGEQTFFGAGDASGLSRLGSVNPEHGEKTTVTAHTTTLDAYYERHHLKPDCVLIDVEGGELQVLRGARRMLAASAPIAVVEIHPLLWDGADGADEVRRLAAAANRQIVALTGQRDPLRDYGTIALERDPSLEGRC